jgi:hypothetical protein
MAHMIDLSGFIEVQQERIFVEELLDDRVGASTPFGLSDTDACVSGGDGWLSGSGGAVIK